MLYLILFLQIITIGLIIIGFSQEIKEVSKKTINEIKKDHPSLISSEDDDNLKTIIEKLNEGSK